MVGNYVLDMGARLNGNFGSVFKVIGGRLGYPAWNMAPDMGHVRDHRSFFVGLLCSMSGHEGYTSIWEVLNDISGEEPALLRIVGRTTFEVPRSGSFRRVQAILGCSHLRKDRKIFSITCKSK